MLLYRRRFLLLIRDHFFDAGEGYGTDDMLDPAGIFFRGVRGNVQDVGKENGQRFMPVKNRGRFFQAVFRQHDPPVGLHDDITAFFQDTHGTGYTGLGKIHFRGDVDGADVTGNTFNATSYCEMGNTAEPCTLPRYGGIIEPAGKNKDGQMSCCLL